MPDNEPYDWVDDDAMGAEETLRRFEALDPGPTTGPPAARNFVFSWDGSGGVAVQTAVQTDAAFAPRTHQQPLTAQPVRAPQHQ